MHAANVAHRDLKPSNCVLVNGVLQIGDFGAAKALGADDHWNPQSSRPGAVWGACLCGKERSSSKIKVVVFSSSSKLL